MAVSVKQSARGRAKGTFHEVKGKVKEKVGQATSNPQFGSRSQIKKIGGKVQKKIGQVEKFLREWHGGLRSNLGTAPSITRFFIPFLPTTNPEDPYS